MAKLKTSSRPQLSNPRLSYAVKQVAAQSRAKLTPASAAKIRSKADSILKGK